jgi:hypothetical protein
MVRLATALNISIHFQFDHMFPSFCSTVIRTEVSLHSSSFQAMASLNAVLKLFCSLLLDLQWRSMSQAERSM